MKKVLCALLVLLYVLAMLPDGTGGWNAPAMADETTIAQIAAGAASSFVLLSDGSLYAWGSNCYGQLGDGKCYAKKTPSKVGVGYTVIVPGLNHTLALKGNDLYAWGFNEYGQLGDGTNIYKYKPVLIGTGYTAVAAGGLHCLALKGNALYAWGNNQYGQLGDGTNIDRTTPVLIGTGYTAISAGFYHSLALKGNDLYSWGFNEHCQLGDGMNTDRNTPMLIGTGYSAIAAGGCHNLALKENILYTWGHNVYGQLGDGTIGFLTNKNTPVLIGTGYTAIAAGNSFSFALKGDILYAWGDNYCRQLGDGTNKNKNVPVQIGTGYTAIAAGYAYSIALKENTILTWGDNNQGQLGDGTKNKRTTHFEVKINIPETSITISPVKVTLYVGGEIATLIAVVSPSNATNKDVIWSSSNLNIVSVTSDGVVNGIKEGTAIITAKTINGKTAKCTVTVKEIKATGIKLDKSSVKIIAGESITLIASVLPNNASNKNVTWTSNNKNIASVSSSGVVTGVKAGKATITAKTANGKTAKCVVTVIPLPSKVTLNRTTMTIIAGKSFTLKATVAPINANDKTITWTSSDEAIAAVSSTGIVTGINKGTATITAGTVNGKTAKCTVKVLAK